MSDQKPCGCGPYSPCPEHDKDERDEKIANLQAALDAERERAKSDAEALQHLRRVAFLRDDATGPEIEKHLRGIVESYSSHTEKASTAEANARARADLAERERDDLRGRLAAAEEKVGALTEALAGLLSVAWPSPDEGHTGFVDRLGMQFYRETGIWPHFKSAPMDMDMGCQEEARRRWSAWLEEKRDAAAAKAASVLDDRSALSSGDAD